MTTTVIVALLLATLLAWAVVVFNRLVRLRNQVQTAWATASTAADGGRRAVAVKWAR